MDVVSDLAPLVSMTQLARSSTNLVVGWNVRIHAWSEHMIWTEIFQQ